MEQKVGYRKALVKGARSIKYSQKVSTITIAYIELKLDKFFLWCYSNLQAFRKATKLKIDTGFSAVSDN